MKCWKGFMEETMANCSQQFDPALCRVVSRRVFTQLVQTEVRAELLHFHLQPSEMPGVQKKKYDKPGVGRNQSNWCHFQPPPFCRVLWLLHLRPCCSHATKTLAPGASLARDCLHIPPCVSRAEGDGRGGLDMSCRVHSSEGLHRLSHW